MKILKTRTELRAWRSQNPLQSLGFVPTLGALHAGHLELVRRARAQNERVLASIFVNPLQFGPGEDLARYPRPFERDCVLLESEGTDALFAPAPAEMYPFDRSTIVSETQLSQGLCGDSRPGHFDGVCTIVLKLLNLCRPTRLYLGEKDAQQLRVISRMVRDLDIDVAIVPVPTVREPDGLALSSRNQYLSPAEREAARALYQSLRGAEALWNAGERDPRRLEAQGRALLSTAAPQAQIEYWEIRHADTLTPLSGTLPEKERPLALVAARIGSTRLIDNLHFQPV